MMETTTYQTAAPEMPIHSNAEQAKPLGINSPRQYRLILAILNGAKATNELIHIIGANNVPDVVMKLRAKGWQIETIEQQATTRDGETVTAGAYRLDTPLEQAKDALRAYKGVK